MLNDAGKKLWVPRSAWLERSAPAEKEHEDQPAVSELKPAPAPPAACYCGGDCCHGYCEIEKARNRQP